MALKIRPRNENPSLEVGDLIAFRNKDPLPKEFDGFFKITEVWSKYRFDKNGKEIEDSSMDCDCQYTLVRQNSPDETPKRDPLNQYVYRTSMHAPDTLRKINNSKTAFTLPYTYSKWVVSPAPKK